MTDLTVLLAYVAPMSIVGGAAWRIATKLTAVDHRLEQLEQKHRAINAEIAAVRALVSIFVDSGRNRP